MLKIDNLGKDNMHKCSEDVQCFSGMRSSFYFYPEWVKLKATCFDTCCIIDTLIAFASTHVAIKLHKDGAL